MTREDYVPCGSTALIDAIGGAIHHIANIHKYARREDVPCRTMFVIITDGYENSSHIYSSNRVKAMIEKEKEKYGWFTTRLPTRFARCAPQCRYAMIGAKK